LDGVAPGSVVHCGTPEEYLAPNSSSRGFEDSPTGFTMFDD
jgi:hypothetical protein